MPYTKEHKARSREKILKSAHALFNARGFDAVTVDEVMENCAMTRGAFYAHFKNKADLYNQTFSYSTQQTKLAELKPEDMPSNEWLSRLLEGYLSTEHVGGERPCPIAFLATDVVNRNEDTKETYTKAYTAMNKILVKHSGDDTPENRDRLLSVTAMMVGAVAISRAIDDEELRDNLLEACRAQAKDMTGW